MTNVAPEDEAEQIMLDSYETFDADRRDGFNGRHSVEIINEAAYFLGEISEPGYRRNKVALNKLAF
jgi:hypothetical protein